MILTPRTMRTQLDDLDRRRRGLYARWQTSWHAYTQTYSFQPPEGFPLVLPGTGKRIVDTVARLLYQDITVHCPPSKDTERAQNAADRREEALSTSLWADEQLAAADELPAPLEACSKYMALFGEGVLLTTLDRRAFAPEPKRRDGESAVDYEERHLAWRRAKANSHPLHTESPPPLYAMRHPDTGHCFLRYRITPEQLDELEERFGRRRPGDISPMPAPSEVSAYGDRTILWEEGWSEDRHVILVDGNEDYPFLNARHYLGFIPFSFARPGTGLPGIFDLQEAGITAGLEHSYAGVLVGLESLLEAQARRLTQLDANISIAVWQGPDIIKEAGAVLPDDWQYEPFGQANEFPAGVDVRWRQVPTLGSDIYRTLEFLDNLIDVASGTRILSGYRQTGTSSGYEAQLLAGLAANVLRPYVTALERATGLNLRHRLMYVETRYFPDGLEYAGLSRKGWATGRITAEDIVDSYHVLTKVSLGLPQDDQASQAKAEKALSLGLWSRRKAAEEGFGTENPDEEETQRLAEDVRLKAREALADQLLEEYSPELAERYRNLRLSEIARTMAPTQAGGAPTGAALGAPGSAIPGQGGPVQPPAALSPEEADLIIRQARAAGRGRMPMPEGA